MPVQCCVPDEVESSETDGGGHDNRDEGAKCDKCLEGIRVDDRLDAALHHAMKDNAEVTISQ